VWLQPAACVSGLVSSAVLRFRRAFKKYHTDHHRYQGEDGVDGDVPSEFECKYVHGALLKLIWVILQPAAYALRPLMMIGKPYCPMEFVNFLVVAAADVAVLYFMGPWSLAYWVCGTLLGALGCHQYCCSV
jgi:sphingolipid 4-desaturase/C4-monooxygenase